MVYPFESSVNTVAFKGVQKEAATMKAVLLPVRLEEPLLAWEIGGNREIRISAVLREGKKTRQ